MVAMMSRHSMSVSTIFTRHYREWDVQKPAKSFDKG